MSLESFVAQDSSEGMSEAAFEAFKEKVKKGAAQMAAAKKKEKKFKKKENDLAHILVKFIKSSNKKKLVSLISSVLEKEVPANFVLAIVILGNRDILPELETQKFQIPTEDELTFFTSKGKMPLDIRMQLDGWIKNILMSLEEKTKKIYSTIQNEDKKTIPELQELTTYVLDEFIKSQTHMSNQISSTKLTNFMVSISISHAEDIIKTHFQK